MLGSRLTHPDGCRRRRTGGREPTSHFVLVVIARVAVSLLAQKRKTADVCEDSEGPIWRRFEPIQESVFSMATTREAVD